MNIIRIIVICLKNSSKFYDFNIFCLFNLHLFKVIFILFYFVNKTEKLWNMILRNNGMIVDQQNNTNLYLV